MDIDGDSEGACSKEAFKFDSPFVPERGFYQPSSEASWESYQALLCVVEQQLGGFSTPVLCGVAHEVLSVLKCFNFMNLSDKKAEIEKQLGPVPDYLFDQLVEIGDCISDYFRDDELLLIGGGSGGGGEIKSDGRDILFVPEEGFYQPRTEETWTAYKLLLDVIQKQLGGGGDQPEVILCAVAHEVLQILKNEKIDRPEVRREMIENLLNRISDRNYDLLVFVSGIIYDFGHPLATRSSNSMNKIKDFDQWEQKALTLCPPVQQSEINQMFGVPRDDDHDGGDDDDAYQISEKLNELTIDHDNLFYIEDSGGESTEEEEEEEEEEDEDYHICSDGAVEEDEDWVMVDAETF